MRLIKKHPPLKTFLKLWKWLLQVTWQVAKSPKQHRWLQKKLVYQVANDVVRTICGKKDDNGKMMKEHAAYPNLKRCLYLDENISWLKFGKDVKRQVIRIIEFSSLKIKFQTDFSERKKCFCWLFIDSIFYFNNSMA